jgi:phosphotransferase system  glucose/maltose/N-acetylglucosamine-specific IIC component
MKYNMGNFDRIVRIIVAVVIAVLYFTHIITGTLAYVLMAIAGIFILTSFLGSCPLYSVFGINTCGTKKTT